MKARDWKSLFEKLSQEFRRPDEEDSEVVHRLFWNHLTPRQKTIVEVRLGLGGGKPMTQKEIAEWSGWGLGPARIGQLEKIAFQRLSALLQNPRVPRPHKMDLQT